MSLHKNFNPLQIGESFLHAYAFHFGDTPEDAPCSISHNEERPAGVFDLLSEAKRAAKLKVKECERVTGSNGWAWCVERRELTSVRYGSSWDEPTERWSSIGGHEGREVFA